MTLMDKQEDVSSPIDAHIVSIQEVPTALMHLPDHMAPHLIDAGFPGLITKSLQQVWREGLYGRLGR